MLEAKKMERIYEIQQGMQAKFRHAAKEGVMVDYLGKKFRVYPSVFWPSLDSTPLVKNYEIRPGEEVLDMCTGSGAIAIFSALKGAKKVVAVDINPEAIRCAKENARAHGVARIVEPRVSDMFSAIKDGEKFDVITMNPPFTPHPALDNAELTVWDQDLHVHRAFFAGVNAHLKQGGRIYLSQAKFGAIAEMHALADGVGFSISKIGEARADEDRVFYAFELKRK